MRLDERRENGTDPLVRHRRHPALLPNLFIAYDMSGAVIHEDHYAIDDAWQIAQQIRHFSDCIRDDQVIPVSTAREHLANVAVIESASLSAKTQLPEKLKVYGKLLSM